MIEKIADVIREGNYAVVAARCAGIDEKTYYSWLQWGGEGREPYAAFLQSIKAAEATAEREAVTTARAGSSGQFGVAWASAMTFLERRWPDRWAKRDPDKMSIAEMDRRLKQLEIELAETKLADLRARDASGSIDPNDEAAAKLMRDRFGESALYANGSGETH